MNYYNENDPKCAAWLRKLIAAKLIPEGDIDERSIREVKPTELVGYAQHHFFAGIGGWSAALRLAGWPDDKPVWTGSCPCQPFSCAGKRKGSRDARHLWPVWLRLIAEYGGQHGIPVTFGEQVASAAGRVWLSGVRSSLETLGYRVGATDLCAAGVGAPHIRQRLYWLAESRQQREGWRDPGSWKGPFQDRERPSSESGGPGDFVGMGDTEAAGLQERVGNGGEHRQALGAFEGQGSEQASGASVGLADAQLNGGWADESIGRSERRITDGWVSGMDNAAGDGCEVRPQLHREHGRKRLSQGCDLGAWSDYDWLQCRDGKQRRFKPGIYPLSARLPGRVVLLRGYGNAICVPLAVEFIKAYLESC